MEKIINQMTCVAKKLSVQELKKELTLAMDSDLDTLVFEALLNALESKISQDEYIKFCDSLYSMS